MQSVDCRCEPLSWQHLFITDAWIPVSRMILSVSSADRTQRLTVTYTTCDGRWPSWLFMWFPFKDKEMGPGREATSMWLTPPLVQSLGSYPSVAGPDSAVVALSLFHDLLHSLQINHCHVTQWSRKPGMLGHLGKHGEHFLNLQDVSTIPDGEVWSKCLRPVLRLPAAT